MIHNRTKSLARSSMRRSRRTALTVSDTWRRRPSTRGCGGAGGGRGRLTANGCCGFPPPQNQVNETVNETVHTAVVALLATTESACLFCGRHAPEHRRLDFRPRWELWTEVLRLTELRPVKYRNSFILVRLLLRSIFFGGVASLPCSDCWVGAIPD